MSPAWKPPSPPWPGQRHSPTILDCGFWREPGGGSPPGKTPKIARPLGPDSCPSATTESMCNSVVLGRINPKRRLEGFSGLRRVGFLAGLLRFFDQLFGLFISIHRVFKSSLAQFMSGQMICLAVGFSRGVVDVACQVVKFRGSTVCTLGHGVLLPCSMQTNQERPSARFLSSVYISRFSSTPGGEKLSVCALGS